MHYDYVYTLDVYCMNLCHKYAPKILKHLYGGYGFMQSAASTRIPALWCKLSYFVLALFWFTGLILGITCSLAADESVFALMRLAPRCQVSIVGLFAVMLLPFLFTAVAVWFHKPWLILPIACFKAVSFGYSNLVTVLSFGSAGWLVRILLLFSDICTLPVLCWLWLRYIPGNRSLKHSDLAVCIVAILIIGCIDHCFVLPYLATLIA